MKYMKLPYYEGMFYPAYHLPKENLKGRLGKAFFILGSSYKVTRSACCINHAVAYFESLSPQCNRYIIIEKVDNELAEKPIVFPIYMYFKGEVNKIINAFNLMGISVMYNKEKPHIILIMPDYFDEDIYKN